MSGYIKNIVINMGADGQFASATSQSAGVMVKTDDGEVEEAQPNVSIDLKALKAMIAGL